jgi:hypothetical protein
VSESNISERGIGQRGADKEPREFNPKSLLNLKQFRKPVSKANLSVNPAVNSGINWNKLGIIAVFVITVGLLIWKIRKKESDSDQTN